MDPTTTRSAPPARRHLWWSLVFGVAGVALLPWIVILAVVQPPTAAVGNLPLAAGGALATITGGLLVSAVLTLTGSPFLTMTAGATAALAVCAGFFHVVTGTATYPRAAAVATVVVLGPVAVLCAIVARNEPARSRTSAVLFVLAAVATLLAWQRSAAAGFPAQEAHHLKLIWITLDVAEAVALITTALALRHRPTRVPVAASVAGALLCCDVWFNVVGAVGEARTEAIQMAFVSIPLGLAAFVIGALEIRSSD
ncbi:hypothetical protein LQ327_13870 [Actinomycetospora endophytica]|uniref:Uncharacterized protein n=1 Tax=Actinomycetospora endophytica TaxID=2291215 RepID=A0ABS8P8W8_9PSEU|nr:hypothetical protein [Actinomycetospora endophytica]MCD2194458.1 hypothetical protein [Actinomycetospora endophytica]